MAELVRSSSAWIRADAVSLALELEQIDPEEPSVRTLADAVHSFDDDGENGWSGRSSATSPLAAVGDTLLYARALLGTGRATQAERELLSVLAIDAGNPVAKLLLFRAKQLQSNLRDAMRLWESMSQTPGPMVTVLAELRQLYDHAVHGGSTQNASPAASPREKCRAELETAFQVAASGNVADAVAMCSRLVESVRRVDRSAYKLAVIAHAWLLEVVGRPDLARRVLDVCGKDPGFEGDLDILLSQGRLLEQDPEALDDAIRIYESLFEKIGDRSLLSRLGRLYERIGDAARADRLRRRHQGAFEQDLGFITPRQLIRMASRRHFYLADLAQFDFDSSELAEYARSLTQHSVLATRKSALFHVLQGDRSAAEGLLRGLADQRRATSLDLVYLGELALLGDRRELASTWYRESLQKVQPTGGPVPESLLMGLMLASSQRDTGSRSAPRSISRPEFSDPARVHDALAAVARVQRSDPGVWRALACASRLLGREEESSRHEVHARFLEQASSTVPPGHALAVAAYHARGDRKGMVHELWVNRYRTRAYGAGQLAERDIFANATDDFRLYLRSVFDSVKSYARAKFPHLAGSIEEYAYQFKLTNEDERSSGPSAGLAIAMAFLSLFLGRPIPADTALSGVLVTEARDRLALRRVGDADIKAEGALARRIRRFILPHESRADIEQSDILPAASANRIVVYASDLDEALQCVYGPNVWLW